MSQLPYKDILKTLGIFALGFAVILVVAKYTNKLIGTNSDDITIRKIVECPLDTQSYQATAVNKNLILLQDKSSFGVNGSFADHSYTVSIKRTGLKSQIVCGYLFYRVSVNNKPIRQDYENLYMTPTNSKQFGGHILPDGKNAISINEINNKTEILIPLNNIYYDGKERIGIKQADWASLLNVTDQMSFDVALNTTSPLGHIDSIEIAYKCWNPQTGESTDDCKLELVE